MSEFTPEQCRAARGLLDWSQADLSERAKIAHKTLWDFEHSNRSPYAKTLARIRETLEKAGVEFIAENGGGPGVRMRKPKVLRARR